MRKTRAADINTIRKNNLSLVLNIIQKTGSISRADLVRQTQLSATTVSSLVNILIDSGFVDESGIGESSGGRPPILLQFNYNARQVLGVELGSTHITAVSMDLNGLVVAREMCAFDVVHNPVGATAAIVDLVGRVMKKTKLKPDAFLGIGIAAPAPLDGDNQEKLSQVILPLWADYDFINELRRHFDIPIYLENDANAGAIAEKWWGEGMTYSDLVYVKLGTGIGSGLIINHEIYRGSGGTAGEIGHTAIYPTGPICRCGNQGCLESLVGIPAILEEARVRLNNSRPEWWSNGNLTIDSIIGAALSGDPTMRGLIENAGSFLGIAIANLVNLFNPGIIVLGGDLVAAQDLLLNAVRTAVAPRTMSKAAKEVIIKVSSLGDDAIAIGAATLAMQNAFLPSNLMQMLAG